MSANVAWIVLIIAGLLEVGWSTGLKYTEGFTKPLSSLAVIVTLALNMYLLARVTEVLPMGTAYAVWVGIGAVGAVLAGIFLFHESASPLRLCFVALLLISIVGLKLTHE